MLAQFLVCPPTPSAFVGSDARRQWDRFMEALQCAGEVLLVEVPSQNDAPGLVFLARGALIIGNLAIISSFRYPKHHREPAIVRRALTRIGLATTYLRQTYFEGAADTLFDPARPICYAGYGLRTERSATLQLQEIVACRLLPLMLVDERFPHLDMALCPLASGHVLLYMNAFSSHAQTLLRRTIDPTYLIEIDINDALDLSCSAVEIGDVLVLHRVSRGLRERLNSIGYRVFCTELEEFIRVGGSAKRMALRFDEDAAAAMQANRKAAPIGFACFH